MTLYQYRSSGYQTEELVFNDRDEVIAYIASIQLLRSDVPEETRRYLIGKRFEAEKAVAHRQKISDWNLYTRNADIHGLAYRVFNPAQLPRPNQSIRTPAAFRLANEYCVSADTIDKYGRCAKAIDIIAEKDIALAKMLISGKYRIFYNKRSKAKLPIRRLYGNVTDEELEADEESIEDYE